ncbi:MAG: NGG1p interacting factor NIF3 [Lentisphaeria bacterium]|nr:NGG1p interacting factor NIF3 [Lentisphaeria bacterium]
MYQLVIYVPETHRETVKKACFAAGAGKLGNYDCCCFETSGTGQFRPLPGSDPFCGSEGSVCKTPEVKLEMICSGKVLAPVIAALLQAHPYETPAYHYFPVCDTPPDHI